MLDICIGNIIVVSKVFILSPVIKQPINAHHNEGYLRFIMFSGPELSGKREDDKQHILFKMSYIFLLIKIAHKP